MQAVTPNSANGLQEVEIEPISILLVEDNVDQADLIRYSFKSYPGLVRLTTVYSLRQARRHLEEHVPDLVIVDFHLKDGTGIDLFKDRKIGESIPFVIMSNDDSLQTRNASIEAGAVSFIAKSAETLLGMPLLIDRFVSNIG
ncbi:response regulator [Deltaproteobacteria bacterium TL4]